MLNILFNIHPIILVSVCIFIIWYLSFFIPYMRQHIFNKKSLFYTQCYFVVLSIVFVIFFSSGSADVLIDESKDLFVFIIRIPYSVLITLLTCITLFIFFLVSRLYHSKSVNNVIYYLYWILIGPAFAVTTALVPSIYINLLFFSK